MRRYKVISPLFHEGIVKPAGALVELEDTAAKRLIRMGVVEEVGEDYTAPVPPPPEPEYIPKLVKQPRRSKR